MRANDPLLKNLGMPPKEYVDLKEARHMPKPKIVMAVSRSYYTEAVYTIASIQKHLPHEKILLYDIGLTRRQIKLVSVSSYVCQNNNLFFSNLIFFT